MKITIKGMWGLMMVLPFIASIMGCTDNNVTPGNGNTSANGYVNSWILDNMKTYYLWNDKLPAKPDMSLAPDLFFESLLFTQEDRFSWIEKDYQALLNSLQGVNKEAGYDIRLYRESTDNQNVIAQVMYIKRKSLVETNRIDLKRGDVIRAINGQALTLANYQELLGKTSDNHSVTYSRYNAATATWVDKGTVNLATAEYAENPNYLDTVYTISGRKIGYYVYNFFATGPTASSTVYNNEMDAVFGEFKTKGVTDLILDLRFNSGGAEGATINLASLVGTGVDNSDVFTKRQYNALLQAELQRQYGSGFFIKNFVSAPNNIGTLNSNRVYILTSSRTASASELLINGLKPFMNVYLIGTTTYGKNVGSISIYEENDPKITWGMQPIVVKSYNSLDQSDYSNGFKPDIDNADNSLTILPLGDINENLLSIAISQIVPETASRKTVSSMANNRQVLATSAEVNRASYNLVIDDTQLQKVIKEISAGIE